MADLQSPTPISKLVDHKMELSNLMGTLLKASINSDITFHVEDKTFRAHRAILSIQSPILRDLLETTNEKKIVLADRRAAPFELFLRYLYTGIIDVTNVANVDISVPAEVLSIAHQYGVENLEASLGEKLKEFVNLDSVFILYQVAFDIKLEGLLNYCRDFMCANAKAIVRSDLFCGLSEKAVIDLISNDFFAAPEMEILRTVTIWHDVHPDVDLTGIFEQVRFHLVCLNDWGLVEVCKICNLLNNYNLNLEQLVSPTNEDGKLKRFRYMLATKNLADVRLGASVLKEGNVKHGSYMIDVSRYARRKEGDSVIIGHETKIKGKGSFVTVKLPKICYVNSLSIIATNRTHDLNSSHQDGYALYSSIDNSKWTLIADCRNRDCIGCKALIFFPTRPVQYLRIFGVAKNESDSLFVVNFMCPAECSQEEIARYKAACKNGQTLLYIPNQDREVVL